MMDKYKVTYYEGGVKHVRIITAKDKDEAQRKAWCITDAESVYVEKVEG